GFQGLSTPRTVTTDECSQEERMVGRGLLLNRAVSVHVPRAALRGCLRYDSLKAVADASRWMEPAHVRLITDAAAGASVRRRVRCSKKGLSTPSGSNSRLCCSLPPARSKIHSVPPTKSPSPTQL